MKKYRLFPLLLLIPAIGYFVSHRKVSIEPATPHTVVPPKTQTQWNPIPEETVQKVKSDPRGALEKGKALSLQEFLIAIQSLEKTEPEKALSLLKERVLETKSPEERPYLIAFPRRFLKKGSHREFSLWALNQKNLKLETKETLLALEVYFTETPRNIQDALRDLTDPIRARETDYDRFVVARALMFETKQPKRRERLAQELEKISGISSQRLLSEPARGASHLEFMDPKAGNGT